MSKSPPSRRLNEWLSAPWLSACLVGLGLFNGLASFPPRLGGAGWAMVPGGTCLLVGSMGLALATGLAFWTMLRKVPPRIRKAAVLMFKLAAYYPFLAFAWLVVGVLVGRLRWPVEGLLPPLAESCFACTVWNWGLPTIVLAIPLAAEFAAALLWNETAAAKADDTVAVESCVSSLLLGLGRQMESYALLAAVFLIIAQDVFRLGGSAELFHQFGYRGLSGWLITAGVTGLIWRLVFALLTRCHPSMPAPSEHLRRRCILDGAIAVGLSRGEAWRRHLLPLLMEDGLRTSLVLASWMIVVAANGYGYIRFGSGKQAFGGVIDGDMTFAELALLPGTLALCLWLLSRMFVTSNLPKSHGRK